MRTIAFLSTKGGVAKTTTTVNLASAMHRAGKRVMVLDLDTQGSAGEYLLRAAFTDTSASWLGYQGHSVPASMCTYVARNGEDAGYGLIHVIPGDEKLLMADQDLRGNPWDLDRLSALLPEIEGDYDYCLIDCSRATGPLEVNAIKAADLIVTPMTLEPASSVGIRQVIELRDGWSKVFRFPPLLFLPTKLDGRVGASERMLDDLRHKFGAYPEGPLLEPIRYAAAYVNSYYESKTVFELEGSSAERAIEDTEAFWNVIRDYHYAD